MYTYPYFFLGFETDIRNISPKLVGDLSIFKRFTFEDAIKAPDLLTVKSVNLICGIPEEINPNEPASVCNYKPIFLKDFIASGGYVMPEAAIHDRRNLKIYMNGNIAEEGEDYEIEVGAHRIKILWEVIKPTDVFSFVIPMKMGA
jgi:hypothetical protein